MDYTLINTINKMVQQENKEAFFKLAALKEKYQLTEEDMEYVPKPHYKNLDFVLRICQRKNPQKRLNTVF